MNLMMISIYGEFFDSAIIYDLTIRYQIYNNAKLQQIYKALYHRDVEIEEDSRAYYLQCPCCGFYGLSLEPDWDGCSICLWEYDGQHETRYSLANRMTMIEYRQNFYKKMLKLSWKKIISVTNLYKDKKSSNYAGFF